MKQTITKKNMLIVIGLLFAGFVLGGVLRPGDHGTAMAMTVYKSPTCGCCVNYIAMLRRNNYEVEVIETKAMDSIKDKYDIPRDMESCHTTVIGDQIAEGHIPLEVVQAMMEDSSIGGIALPGMPAGSPGMPGTKAGPFQIYELGGDGELFMSY